jgi:hypothetical protein
MRVIYHTDSVTVYRTCMLTGDVEQMTFNVDPQVFAEAHAQRMQGALIQDAFPFLNADQREFLMSGITPVIWNRYFGEFEN